MFFKFNNNDLLDNKLFHKDDYTAQGFATSPMMANIAIIDVLKDIDSKLKENFSEYAFTIYADDIQISTNIDDRITFITIKNIVREVLNKYNFRLNEKKSRIKFAKYGYRRILGVNVGETEVRATRATIRKIRAAAHNNNKTSLGGLVNWSKCSLPKSKKEKKAKIKPNIANTMTIKSVREQLEEISRVAPISWDKHNKGFKDLEQIFTEDAKSYKLFMDSTANGSVSSCEI